MKPRSLFELFQNSTQTYPNHEALVVDGQALTYSEAEKKILSLANGLNDLLEDQETSVAICGYRSMDKYLSLYTTLATGRYYIPINPLAPAERNLKMLKTAECKTVIVCSEALEQAKELKHLEPGLKFVVIDEPLSELDGFLISSDSAPLSPLPPASRYAYALFTSGSSGEPKGVLVTQNNVLTYVDNITERFELKDSDRFAQMVDLTFDLSAHDIFCSARVGAALYVVPPKEKLAPGNFLKKNQITTWLAVPSVSHLMGKLKQLKENHYSDLRLCFFCGEALLESTAMQWQKALAQGDVINIYGPTEATIAITHYNVPKEEIKSRNGIVSIGQIFGDHEAILDEGELLLKGPQVSAGYLNNPEATQKNFVSEDTYRTGDIVERDDDGDLFFIQRKDLQVKVRGHRIELPEIEHHLQKLTGASVVATVVAQNQERMAEELVSFIYPPSINDMWSEMQIKEKAQGVLPDYMIPKKVIFCEELPFNKNDKLDRKQLKLWAEESLWNSSK